MQVYVVNLQRSPERREAIAARLDALGADFSFFPAIDASKGETAPFASRVQVDRRRLVPLSPGEVGCFASHFQLWELCAERDQAMAILEDDARPNDAFCAVLDQCDVLLKSGHHLVRLHGTNPRPHVPVASLPGGVSLVRFTTGPRGSVAYVIAPSGARRLLKHATLWREGVDFYIDRFGLHGVGSYAVLPYCVEHVHGPSEIGAREAGLQQSVRWRALKLGDSAMRRIANARFRLGELLG